SARGRGVGRSLKTAQIEWARRHGYRFICGRNKIGATDEMSGLNRSLGAYTALVLDNQYDGESQAEYYRIPLLAPVPAKKHHQLNSHMDLASGIQAPSGPRPEFMQTRELVGPVAARLHLTNWATPDTAPYAQHLRAIPPAAASELDTPTSRAGPGTSTPPPRATRPSTSRCGA